MATITIPQLPSRAPKFEMPSTYDNGVPLYWRNEQTGILSAAIFAYINHAAEPTCHPAPTPAQLSLTIAYLKYFINAPAWQEDDAGMLTYLRAKVWLLASVDGINQWIEICLGIGLDPL